MNADYEINPPPRVVFALENGELHAFELDELINIVSWRFISGPVSCALMNPVFQPPSSDHH